jgi:MoaA/NifB/PqqE/SkfB family radical SAM enzyme
MEGRDFISSFDLVPLGPSIDVAGVCNLRCQGCPRGDMAAHPPAGFMSAEVYAQVIDKLLREMPFLGEVQLYTWGEPLLNRELPRIIGHNKKRRVLSIVSTNLCLKTELVETLAEAGPEIVRVSCSGWGANYEITHTGGNWELFLKNLHRLAELNRELGAGIELELYYHLYRHNTGEDYEKMKTLAEELGYVFRPITASLYPRENVIDLRLGRPLSPPAQRQLALLTPEARAMLFGDGQSRLGEPCPENRCFAINWNLNVRVCGVCYAPTVADNFLETPLPELVRRVAESEACARCAACGAHCFVKPIMADQRAAREN